MKTITLTQGQKTLVDDEDFEYLTQWKWYAARVSAGNFYARRKEYWKDETGKLRSKSIHMHRVIMGLGSKLEDPRVIDHKNHDTLDNQKSNLRVATQLQNWANRTPQGGTSQYTGVYKVKYNGRWASNIRANKNKFHLGTFDSEKEAALAYDTKATELHGEFACLNFPNER